MVQRALATYPEFELSRIEIDRPPPHFAVDTVEMAKKLYPDQEVLYIIGGDSLHDLPGWHDPAGLVTASHQIGVMRRPGDSIDLGALEAALPGVSAKLAFVDAPLLEISAREIRHRAETGRAYRHYLLPGVYDYIVSNALYRPSGEPR
jgi:nicotinate-nucleotide adenylyltransferase